MYREDQIKVALGLCLQCGSVTKTIRLLGYPSRRGCDVRAGCHYEDQASIGVIN